MLQVKHLNIMHSKDLKPMVEDFNFVLNRGDRAVIIGEEGNGKSTLLKWIVDPELVADYTEAEGERICTGERLGYLPQELSAADCMKTVYEYFSGNPVFWEQDPKELALLARRLGLTTEFFYSEQRMGTLSGGEKIKAQMAGLLMYEPTILLLDEPSNDIDIETLKWLEELLLTSGKTFLYVSHDETLIERTANVIIHMEQLRRKTVSRYTVVHLSYTDYIAQRTSNFKKQEQEASNDRRQEKIRQEKFQRIQQRVEHEQHRISRQDPHGGQLLKKKMKAVKSLEKRYERESDNMTQMPEQEEAIGIRFDERISVPAGKTILEYSLNLLESEADSNMERKILARDIEFRVKGPEKVCIIGKNGVGKTTLLKKIALELLERKDIHAAYMPQNYEDLLEMDQTPVEYLSVTGDKEELTKIRTYLGSMKYTTDEMSHSIFELSGGQKAKVLLLKMNLSGANVLILDEPTRNFSPLSNPVIREILRGFGGAIISISHDRKYIQEVCGTVYEMTEEGLVKRR